jgi:hypothetical protein
MKRFVIATDRVGPRRWCWVRIHADTDDLARAAERLLAECSSGEWAGTLGCFQPTPATRKAPDGSVLEPPNGYAGVLRLADGWITPEIVAHELVHAAVQIYRMNVHYDVRLGNGCREREEQLAYIYGELYASLASQLDFP